MLCRKCQREAPNGAVYCPFCGISLKPTRRKSKRGNGLGSAYKRGNSWESRIVVRYEASGDPDHPGKKPVWKTKGGFKTKREALEYCAILKQEYNKPKGPAPQLLDYWNIYSEGELKNIGKSKQSAYKTAWNKIKDGLQYRPVDQITVAEIRDNVSKVASTYYTTKDCKTVLTKLFELAGADGWCSKDLPSYIVLPKLEEAERIPFNDDEQAALWKLYDSGDIRAAVPLLMICTGIMPGEIQKLKVENIDLEHRKIIHASIKTEVRKNSAIYFPEEVLPILEDLIANARPNGYLWPLNEKKWYDNYYDALKAAGCRRLEPYSCRHTTATRFAIDKKVAPQTVKRIMRWSTTKMLDRYAHPDEDDILEATKTFSIHKAEDKNEPQTDTETADAP